VTNQRRFLFVSAAAPRASLRYCKHQKECRIRVKRFISVTPKPVRAEVLEV
jgi:hypothetical protein